MRVYVDPACPLRVSFGETSTYVKYESSTVRTTNNLPGLRCTVQGTY